jgi:hypothetical protein
MPSLKVVSVLRNTVGLDEFPIYKKLLCTNFDVFNIDDRLYGLSKPLGLLHRILRKFVFRKYFIRQFNEDLTALVKTERPNILLVFKGSLIQSETVNYANEIGVNTILIYPDLDPQVYGSKYVSAMTNFKYVFHTKPNRYDYFRSINKSASVIGPFFDINEVSEPELVDEKLGVSFVGHYSAGKINSIIKFARLFSGNVTVFGDNWKTNIPLNCPQNLTFHPSVYGPYVSKIYQTSICSLGLLQEGLRANQSGDVLTARSALIPVLGGVALHAKNVFSTQFFEGAGDYLFETIEEAAIIATKLRENTKLRSEAARLQKNAVLKNGTEINNFVEKILKL